MLSGPTMSLAAPIDIKNVFMTDGDCIDRS